jgi:membrane-bound metal-dependent hydrolase YbcI (DUF457 family)
MAQAVCRLRLTAGARVRARFSPLGFVAHKVAVGHIPVRVLRFPPVIIILPWLPIFIYHLGYERRPIRCPQFRDIVSPHRHRQQQQIRMYACKITYLIIILPINV